MSDTPTAAPTSHSLRRADRRTSTGRCHPADLPAAASTPPGGDGLRSPDWHRRRPAGRLAAGVNAKVVDPFFWGEPERCVGHAVDWSPSAPPGLARRADLRDPAGGRSRLRHRRDPRCGLRHRARPGQLLAELFAPFLKAANSIPRIILGSIFTVAFGFGIQSKVILAVVLVFFGVFFNAFQGTREVDRNLIANARLLGASRWRVTRDVVLPSAFTWILASLHISFGFALIGALVGEILGANKGLGRSSARRRTTST